MKERKHHSRNARIGSIPQHQGPYPVVWLPYISAPADTPVADSDVGRYAFYALCPIRDCRLAGKHVAAREQRQTDSSESSGCVKVSRV